MSEFETKTGQIEPIKFKNLNEDGYTDATGNSDQKIAPKNKPKDVECANFRCRKRQKSNFSFEYSYPAVIFDRVSFSVDRSQQQANFFNGCAYRLKSLIGAISQESRQQEKVNILKSINLSVPYGSIFGLLGPSSCGKTTLLRCLVGLLKPSSGSISLFSDTLVHSKDEYTADQSLFGYFSHKLNLRKNKRSNSRARQKSKVPGSNVGYMPQDLGLYEDFTIRQLLTMFGRYMGMSDELIVTRIEFMASFLDLPEVDRQIQSLSGGQKRRVSFAIACIHMPPLIILDEPTVGVDPLLRQSIWKYLRRLADEENKTIIITTHYIEEAAQADQVAFMRAGEILVQDTPSRIMESNGCNSLEEAFLKICNNVRQSSNNVENSSTQSSRYKLYPQPRFNWHDEFPRVEFVSETQLTPTNAEESITLAQQIMDNESDTESDLVVKKLKIKAQEKLQLFDELRRCRQLTSICEQHNVKLDEKINKLSMAPNMIENRAVNRFNLWTECADCELNDETIETQITSGKSGRKVKKKSLRGAKWVINGGRHCNGSHNFNNVDSYSRSTNNDEENSYQVLCKSLALIWALLYKNYRRNLNSLPLLAFQFMLPVIQMISFSLCVGGRPTNIGLGLVNHDQPIQLGGSLSDLLTVNSNNNITKIIATSRITSPSDYFEGDDSIVGEELLSQKYLSFIDRSMISLKPYANLKDALDDVRKAKLWAAMEIGENFTSTILRRFDLDNFYQLDPETIQQSVIRLYPDRSNKVLDMICHRSLVNSYRTFLSDQFEHFKRLPIEVKEPIFDIKPNLISNSIDGYTESIAAGLLASLTYIMAAGLTTFIMVVERSAGILERTYTSGINPIAYLMAHALFRSVVMMLQIAVVMFLTFYLLKQPIVGSIWLAYLMLMTLNLTGISYGLLISSLVTDQNGAALTIVSSLVVKITMSGILWPFEAIPVWLRTICYLQPLTMPVQALKGITLKGNGLEDRTVRLGFVVSLTWLAIFLTISARRFKFYQH